MLIKLSGNSRKTFNRLKKKSAAKPFSRSILYITNVAIHKIAITIELDRFNPFDQPMIEVLETNLNSDRSKQGR
tara:strand:- start:768 stop:989 length:222 start_codon:yes stop_codon:yes gene_type:complete